MPTSIAITIARQLGTDPNETERVLDSLVQDIRHDVARHGYATVPGLGAFRFFEGTIVFEPDQALALAVNHRYAGLDSLLVSSSGIRHSLPAAVPQDDATAADESATASYEAAEPADAWAPEADEPLEDDTDEALPVDPTLPPPYTPSWHEYTEDPADEDFIPEEDEDAAPPPEYTEIVPTGFDPETHEMRREEEQVDATPIEADSLMPQMQPGEDPGQEEIVEEASAPLSEDEAFGHDAPVIDEDERGSVGEDDQAAEEEIEQELVEEPQEETQPAGEYPEETPGFEAAEPEIIPPLPDVTASPFFEPWPEDLPDLNTPAEVDTSFEQERFASQEPTEDEVLPVEPAQEGPQVEDTPEMSGESEPAAEEAPPAVQVGVYETPGSEPTESEAIENVPPVAGISGDEESRNFEPMVAPVFEAKRPEAVREKREQQRPLTPWLIAAVAVIGIAMAYVFFSNRPGGNEPPAQMAQNEPPVVLPSDTSGAPPADTTAVLADRGEPAEPVTEPVTNQPAEDVSPLRKPGGIDVGAGGLTLIVASTPSRTSAEAMAERFRQQGYTTAIFYGQYGGVTRYRVGVGQFSDQRAAEVQLEDLPEGFPGDAWPMPIRSEMEIYQ